MADSYNDYYEQQYNNRQRVPEHPQFLQDWAHSSANFRQTATANALLDISYGSDKRETLDIFLADVPNAATHIFIHGGYWQALSKDAFSFMAQAFNQQGENAVILNYSLCPQVSITTITSQIRQAIAWIIFNGADYGLNTSQVQLTGHSAGGHLVAEMLVCDWKNAGLKNPPFRQATSLSGLFELTPLIQTSVNDALKLNLDSASENSPIFKRPKLNFPIALQLIVGELESESYQQQSSLLADKWKSVEHLTLTSTLAPGLHHFSILDGFLKNYYQPLHTD